MDPTIAVSCSQIRWFWRPARFRASALPRFRASALPRFRASALSLRAHSRQVVPGPLPAKSGLIGGLPRFVERNLFRFRTLTPALISSRTRFSETAAKRT